MRLALVLVALAGCDFVFRLDPVTSNGDARHDSITGDGHCTTATVPFAAVSCGSVTFAGAPVELVELAGSVAGDPSMRGDQLELFYSRLGQRYQLAYATRPTVTSPFVVAGDVPFGNPTATETDPSVSADGSYVAFISDRGGAGNHAFLAHRACDTWEVVPMPGLETNAMVGLELSYDARALYFSTSSNEILEARRDSTSEPFGVPTLAVTNGNWPAISSDELELYYTQDGVGGVFRATRTTVGIQFDAPTVATPFGGDPDLTPDGEVLVLLRTGNSVQVMRRNCP